MAAAKSAVLAKLKLTCSGLFILRRAVVPPATFRARERDDIPIAHPALLLNTLYWRSPIDRLL
jgi:hypothetical protein